MNSRLRLPLRSARFTSGLLRLYLLLPSVLCLRAPAQGTAFTYQGRLSDGGTPANGSYDLRLRLAADALGNTIASTNVLVDDLALTNGLFTLTLDFGAAVFDGSARWLEIGVRPGASTGSYTILDPLTPVTSTPYALRAAQLTGTLASNSLAGSYGNAVTFNNPANSFAGNGSGLINVNAGTLAGLGAANLWQLGGNNVAPGQFLGTTNNEPLELRVNNQRVLRLEPDAISPKTVAGFSGNVAAAGAYGASIGGGGFPGNPNRAESPYTTIGGGSANTNAGDGAFIGGGFQNAVQAVAYNATLVGGAYNRVGTNSGYSAIAGGWDNTIAADSSYAVNVGGQFNNIAAGSSFGAIGGGQSNVVAFSGGTVGGGVRNRAEGGPVPTVAGGQGNTAGGHYTAVGGGLNNTAIGYTSTVGGGGGNNIETNADHSVIGGGLNNRIQRFSFRAVIGGGEANVIHTNVDYGTIGGGQNNAILTNASWATIGGGGQNTVPANSFYGTIPGGQQNSATNYAFAAGRRAKANHPGAFVWADSTDLDIASTNANSMTFRASGGVRLFADTNATAGVFLAPGGTSWSTISDRATKKNFAPVDGRAVLERLAAVPMQHWNYLWEADDAVPNLGPVAQEFKAAFYPGRDDKTITTLEFDGVEMAAIQGLNEKVEIRSRSAEARSRMLEEKLQEKETEIAELKQRLERLEHLINANNSGRQ